MVEPVVVIQKFLSIQVCVPTEYTDDEVKQFADRAILCGTTHGWHVNEGLGRIDCDDREGAVHVVLDA